MVIVQSGTTCGAINEPGRSSETFNKRLIKDLRDQNVVIARFRDKNDVFNLILFDSCSVPSIVFYWIVHLGYSPNSSGPIKTTPGIPVKKQTTKQQKNNYYNTNKPLLWSRISRFLPESSNQIAQRAIISHSFSIIFSYSWVLCSC